MSRAFSMVELVIVVVIAGIIAAIAVPRVTGYAARAKERRVVADLGTLQKAAEHFAAEHGGLPLGEHTNGATVSAGILMLRLTQPTAYDGTGTGDTIYGPYLRAFPENALNGKKTIRIDGAEAGAGTHGWRYDSALDVFHSDEAFETTMPDGTVVDHLGGVQDRNDVLLNLGG